MMTATEPTFLYPQSRQFPFDEVCEHIVRALEERNWNVPGITVDFHVYGSGAEQYRMVNYIKGDDFKLWFCRVQGNMGRLNNTAAVTEMIIPKMELHVYDDESGPTFITYVGKNWARDKQDFMTVSKIHSKLNHKPKKYLKYQGGCDCHGSDSFHTHSRRRSPILVHDNDLGREYEPSGKQPKSYRTNEVFTEFTQWLEENLLARILAQPIADEKVDIFRTEVKPFTATVGPIFCFGENRDAERVHQGKHTVEQLEPSSRYGFSNSGFRLMFLGVSNDGTVPKVAYEGFKWCGIGEVTDQTSVDDLEIPGHHRWTDQEKFVFRVTPNRADEIYIADHAPYEKRRSELFEEILPRKRLTDEELNEATRARARTLIPINDYAGGFLQPVVLVCRELDLDEVELVSGPWPEYQYVKLIANHSFEAHALLEEALLALEAYHHNYGDVARQAFLEKTANIVQYFLGDDVLVRAAEALTRQKFRAFEPDAQFIEHIVYNASTARRLGLY